MKRFVLIFISVLCCVVMNAQSTFEYHGIKYSTTGDNTVAVIADGYSNNVNIPATVTYDNKTYYVTSIGDDAFSGCYGLTSITIPEGVTSIGNNAFHGCSGLTSITIPEGVTSIGDNAFSGCSGLTSITIPEGVTSIGDNVFFGCYGLESVTILEGVTSIGDNAFRYCFGLISVTIPSSVTSIGEYAFDNCSGLTSISIPEGVTSIGDYAFSGCSGLTSITIPGSVTNISNFSFYNCFSLTSIIVDSSNKVYDSRYNCNAIVEKATNTLIIGCMNTIIPESVTNIGNHAFEDCIGLTSITIPEGVTSIGKSAFYGCTGLTSITIPESVTSIGEYAFDGCRGLTSITIPESVTSIGKSAFLSCSQLSSVVCGPIKAPTLGVDAFDGVKDGCRIYVPSDAYKTAEGWADYADMIDILTLDDYKQNVIDEFAEAINGYDGLDFLSTRYNAKINAATTYGEVGSIISKYIRIASYTESKVSAIKEIYYSVNDDDNAYIQSLLWENIEKVCTARNESEIDLIQTKWQSIVGMYKLVSDDDNAYIQSLLDEYIEKVSSARNESEINGIKTEWPYVLKGAKGAFDSMTTSDEKGNGVRITKGDQTIELMNPDKVEYIIRK